MTIYDSPEMTKALREARAETEEWIRQNNLRLMEYFAPIIAHLYAERLGKEVVQEVVQEVGQQMLDDGIEIIEGEIIDEW